MYYIHELFFLHFCIFLPNFLNIFFQKRPYYTSSYNYCILHIPYFTNYIIIIIFFNQFMYINLRNLYTSLSLEDFSFEREFWNKFFIYNICVSITLNISQYDFEILDHEDIELKLRLMPLIVKLRLVP